MKLLLSADWHLYHHNPVSRIDNYPQAQYNKIKFMVEYAIDNFIDGIIAAGDIGHSHKLPDWIKERYIRLLRQDSYITPIPIFAIFGQHDMKHHTANYNDVPLGVLLAGCPNMQFLSALRRPLGNLNIYGMSYGGDIPKPTYPEGINILVIHKMIVDEKLWHDQEDYEHGSSIINEHPEYQLIVSGDNHQTFMAHVRKRRLINPGSIMRMTSAQLEHKPCFFIWDSKTLRATQVFFPIEPSELVFSIDKIEREKGKEDRIEAYIAGLKDQVEFHADFKSTLDLYMKQNAISPKVKEIIQEAMRNA